MKQILKQYRNLIGLVTVTILIIIVLASDPLGMVVKRRQERAAVWNQIAIEKAETEKRIAIIQAEQEAELIRIHQGLCDVTAEDIADISTYR